MQTDIETLALAFGEDVRPITDEERVTLIRKMYKDKKLKQEHKDLGEMINSLSYRYGFSWASDKYMANALHTTEKSLKQRISKLKKEQYILVAIVTYHGFFSKKRKEPELWL